MLASFRMFVCLTTLCSVPPAPAGIAPFIATALETQMSPPPLAAAVVILVLSSLTLSSLLPLARLAPHLTVWAPIGTALVNAGMRRP
jgi:hypothetical protein